MLTPWRRRTEMFCSTRLASMPTKAKVLKQVAGCTAATHSMRLRPGAEALPALPAPLPPRVGLLKPQKRPEGHGPQQGMPGQLRQ